MKAGFTPSRTRFQEREIVSLWLRLSGRSGAGLRFRNVVSVVRKMRGMDMLFGLPPLEAVSLLSYYAGSRNASICSDHIEKGCLVPERGSPEWELNREVLISKMRDHIADSDIGWSAMSVFPVEVGGIAFTYTVGLTETFNHPELIVYGLSHELSHGILSCAVDLIRKGTRFEDGGTYEDVLEGYKVKAVDHGMTPLNLATEFYDEFEALHLQWPDSEGRFPGDPDVDWSVELHQVQVTDEEDA